MRVSDFKDASFNRAGGSISFGERAPQPSDFNGSRGYKYAEEYAASPTDFNVKYPNWQAFADSFSIRRAVINMTGTQTCNTCSFRSNDIEDYLDAGFVTVRDFKVPGFSTVDSMPDGKYMNVGMSFTDNRNGYTEVTINYMQYGDWELIQLINDLPDPTKK
jgi:hypothetical protein